MKLLLIKNWQTKNGARVLFVQRHENPMIEVNAIFSAGSAHDGNKYGISQLTNNLLNQGTKIFDTEQIAENFEEIGAQFQAISDRDIAMISLRSLTKPKYLAQALSLFTEVLSSPCFPKKAFVRMQQLVVGAIKQQEQMLEIIARNTLYKTLYHNHPYGNAVLGTLESIPLLTISDLKKFYKEYYVAKNLIITIVGDLKKKKAEEIANQLALSLPSGSPAEKIPLASPITEKIDRQVEFSSQQTQILIGQVGINYKDPNYFPLLVGNQILGGSFVSRLFKEVREKQALVYGINSHVLPLAAKGPFLITFQAQSVTAMKALKITQNVFNDFVTNGPTKKELIAVKKKIINGFPLTLSCNDDISRSLRIIGAYNLSLNYLDEYCEKINAVTLRQIKESFQEYFLLNKMATILVMGSQKKN